MTSKRPLIISLIVGALAVWPAYLAATQGFNLLDDGLWLLGARILTEGGVLYRDLFSIYGPAKFILLLPFFAVMGQSAAALAMLKAVSVGVAAGLGAYIVARRVSLYLVWIPLVGALGLWATRPRYVVAGAFALAIAACLERAPRPRVYALLGLGWAAVAAFGLDAAGYATVILVGTLVLTPDRRPDRSSLIALAGGAFGGLGLLLVIAAATGSLNAALWDTLVYPLTRFGAEMGLSPLDTFRNADVAGVLFLDHQTGEVHTEAWSDHRLMMILARRSLYIGLLALPVTGCLLAWRRRGDPLLAAVTAFAVAGWSTAAVRGEAGHLAAGWLGCLWLLPLLPSVLSRQKQRTARIVASVLALIILIPLAAEPIWLATHADRPGLAKWNRSSAGIRLTDERINNLEALDKNLGSLSADSMLFWPARPGLNFFFDIPAASPQATLLGGEVRNPQTVLDHLADTPDHAVLLHPPHRRDGRGNRDVAPEIWAGLRQHYRVAGRVTGATDEFIVLVPTEQGQTSADLPLQIRLHDQRQSIADEASPAMSTNQPIGQALQLGLAPLSGLAIRPATTAATEMVWDITVRTLDNSTPGRELGRYRLDHPIAAGQSLIYLPFGPVPGSAGLTVLVELKPVSTPVADIRLLWHEKAQAAPDDAAWVAGRPTSAQLYFFSY